MDFLGLSKEPLAGSYLAGSSTLVMKIIYFFLLFITQLLKGTNVREQQNKKTNLSLNQWTLSPSSLWPWIYLPLSHGLGFQEFLGSHYYYALEILSTTTQPQAGYL